MISQLIKMILRLHINGTGHQIATARRQRAPVRSLCPLRCAPCPRRRSFCTPRAGGGRPDPRGRRRALPQPRRRLLPEAAGREPAHEEAHVKGAREVLLRARQGRPPLPHCRPGLRRGSEVPLVLRASPCGSVPLHLHAIEPICFTHRCE